MSGRSASWTSYWAGNSGVRCLPNAGSQISAKLQSIWDNFAVSLPQKAKVLDLGTGSGIVLQRLKELRADLRLFGVDSSKAVPQLPGMTLLADTKMEDLPWRNSSFDAVTSQYGLEYGERSRAIKELCRLLKPQGIFCFVIHNRGGPILGHNLSRREALVWAIRESGYLSSARQLASVRKRLRVPTPNSFAKATHDARKLFPDQSVAWEIITAIYQALKAGEAGNPLQTLAVFDELEAKGRAEIGRLDALEDAACGPDEIAAISAELERCGLKAGVCREVEEAPGKPAVAWLLSNAPPLINPSALQ